MMDALPINETAASTSLHKLIARCALDAGFDGITNSALAEIEGQAVAFMGSLIYLSQTLASSNRRTKGNPTDLAAACQIGGLSLHELQGFLYRLRRSNVKVPPFTFIERIPPLEEEEMALVLPQDANEAEMELNDRLDIQPDFFPPLPPKHSWKRTPVHPESTLNDNAAGETNASKSVHDDRVRTTRLVEASLRNLIQASNDAASRRSAPKSKPITMDEDDLPPPLDLDTNKENQNEQQKEQKERVEQFPMLLDLGDTSMMGPDAMAVNYETSARKRGLAAVTNEQTLNSFGQRQVRMKWVM